MSSDEEDNDCPLCMEEIEVDDKYFKPCPCGYVVCRFCWNHIKNDLNGLCPACRRPYSDDLIQFKPVPPEEFEIPLTRRLSKIKNAKKKKEREKKEQEVQAKKQLANVRVVQKNLVYVLGLPLKLASEETLRSHDYFGQYGKITKVVVNKRTPVVGPNTHAASPATSNTGVYITYAKKEDAARAIEAVDGTNFEGKIIRATFGTTKYCSYFLKGQNCQNIGCQFLHENGEDAEAYLKEEARLQRNERSNKAIPFQNTKREDSEVSLPPSAAWAKGAPLRGQSEYEFESASEYDQEPPEPAPLNEENYPTLGEAGSVVAPPPLAPKKKKTKPPKNANNQEQTLGSSALHDPSLNDGFVPDLLNGETVTPYSLGYRLVPRYNGLFDPFGSSKLAETLLASVAAASNSPVEKSNPRTMSNANSAVGSVPPPGPEPSSTDSSPNRKSRYERLFDGAPPSGQEREQVSQDRWNNDTSRSAGPPPNISATGQRFNYNTTASSQPGTHYQQGVQGQQNQMKIQQYQQILQQQQHDRMNSTYENSQADPAYAASQSGGVHARVSGPTEEERISEPTASAKLEPSLIMESPSNSSANEPSPKKIKKIKVHNNQIHQTPKSTLEPPRNSISDPSSPHSEIESSGLVTPTQQSVRSKPTEKSPAQSPTSSQSLTPTQSPTPNVREREILVVEENQESSVVKSRKSKKKKANSKVKKSKTKAPAPIPVLEVETAVAPEVKSNAAPSPDTKTDVNTRDSDSQEVIPISEQLQNNTPDSSTKDPQESNDVEKIVPLKASDIGLFEDIQTACSILLIHLNHFKRTGAVNFSLSDSIDIFQIQTFNDKFVVYATIILKFILYQGVRLGEFSKTCADAVPLLRTIDKFLEAIDFYSDTLVISLNRVLSSFYAFYGKEDLEEDPFQVWISQKKCMLGLIELIEEARMIRKSYPVSAKIISNKSSNNSASSTNEYIDRLVGAIREYLIFAEVKGPESKIQYPKSQKFPDAWTGFAAAVGIDKNDYSEEDQLRLMADIQKEFPDPQALAILIIEDPNNAKLQELLSNGKPEIPDSRIAVLEQEVINNRAAEEVLFKKLLGIKSRNNIWMDNVKRMLAVQLVDSSDDEWIDE